MNVEDSNTTTTFHKIQRHRLSTHGGVRPAKLMSIQWLLVMVEEMYKNKKGVWAKLVKKGGCCQSGGRWNCVGWISLFLRLLIVKFNSFMSSRLKCFTDNADNFRPFIIWNFSIHKRWPCPSKFTALFEHC